MTNNTIFIQKTVVETEPAEVVSQKGFAIDVSEMFGVSTANKGAGFLPFKKKPAKPYVASAGKKIRAS